MRRLDYTSLRAVLWTLRALWVTRLQLRRGVIEGVRVPPPPDLPEAAIRGVRIVLRRLPNTCLERSLVLQSWLGRFTTAPDVIVGVSGPGAAFRAHAWLEGELEGTDEAFHELFRLPSAERT